MFVSRLSPVEWTLSLPASTTLPSADATLPQHFHCVALFSLDRLSVADVDCR